MKAYSTDYGINGTSLPPRYYNSIPRRVRTVKEHHYLVVVDVGSNNQPVTRKGEWIIICRGVVTVVCTDDNTRVNDDESTTVSILYYHSLTAKDTIRGDLT